jgi:hypothetical protein
MYVRVTQKRIIDLTRRFRKHAVLPKRNKLICAMLWYCVFPAVAGLGKILFNREGLPPRALPWTPSVPNRPFCYVSTVFIRNKIITTRLRTALQHRLETFSDSPVSFSWQGIATHKYIPEIMGATDNKSSFVLLAKYTKHTQFHTVVIFLGIIMERKK